jgi:hypothetical protein
MANMFLLTGLLSLWLLEQFSLAKKRIPRRLFFADIDHKIPYFVIKTIKR